MITQATDVPIVHLKIGECIFTREDICINTVLGSCVAVTLHDAASRWSGMCHAVLPLADSPARMQETPCRFVDSAITQLLDRFRRRGVRPENLQAKLFGGAFCVISPGTLQKMEVRNIVDVGAKNVHMARQMLLDEGVRVSTESTLGERSRKVLFYTDTGRVTLQFLSPVPENGRPIEGRVARKAT